MSDEYLQGWNEYTAITRETAIYPGIASEIYAGPESNYADQRILYCTLGLAGEAGEVVDVVKKEWRKLNFIDPYDPDFRRKLVDELGDVFWYLARLMNETSITVDEVMEANITKLKARKEAGTIKER